MGREVVGRGSSRWVLEGGGGRRGQTFPPTLASTMARRVVGIWTKGMPRMKVAATYPVRSPTTPPPSAMQQESRFILFCRVRTASVRHSMTFRWRGTMKI